jgi:hypothetical protein
VTDDGSIESFEPTIIRRNFSRISTRHVRVTQLVPGSRAPKVS